MNISQKQARARVINRLLQQEKLMLDVCRLCGFKTASHEGHRYITSFEQQFICIQCVKKVVQQARIRHIEPD